MRKKDLHRFPANDNRAGRGDIAPGDAGHSWLSYGIVLGLVLLALVVGVIGAVRLFP